MRHEIKSKDCSLAGASDLTVVAPIKKGFVPGLDAVTYKTRVQRVLKALHTGRSGLHEFELARMLSDAVERVGRIHSVRIAVLEPHDQVLLAVTFDGAWESYVRVIWQKVARLLDLIFCNTEDYVNGWDSSFEMWGAWLRSRQAETSFLYALPGHSTPDTTYLRTQERLLRTGAGNDLQFTQVWAPTAEEIAAGLLDSGQDPSVRPPTLALDGTTEAQPAAFRQGLRSLAGLYKLADLYPPGFGDTQTDGELLLRAAHELLPEFIRLTSGDIPLDVAWQQAQERFEEPLNWFISTLPTPRPREESVPDDHPRLDHPEHLQAGILEPYDDVDHGVLLLLHFASPASVRAFLTAFVPTARADQSKLAAGSFAWNLALSVEGLRAAGVTDAELDTLPIEFVQGMERRASVLGDLRINHPRRWRLPTRNWAAGAAATEPTDVTPAGQTTPDRVPLESVHAMVQLRRRRVSPPESAASARPKLYTELTTLVGPLLAAGVLPLSLQWLQRQHDADAAGAADAGSKTLDHFGFQDGGSDPVFHKSDAGAVYPNHVHPGEALIGYPNAADVDAPAMPNASAWTRELLHNGSFLVLRKLRQDRPQLESVLDDALAAGLDKETLRSKMMGRWSHKAARAGEPLVDRPAGSKGINDFNYEADKNGSKCPFHAHIRRANPRDEATRGVGSRPARLFRRSMSYGPAYDPANAATHAQERGLMFMAYNASLGEQFETVQRWLSGGNSARGYSGQSDPFLGVPEPGRRRVFRFECEHAGAAPSNVHLALDGDADLLVEPTPLVRLEWGGYFFTPSLAAIGLLATRADETSKRKAAEPVGWSVAQGQAAIEALKDVEIVSGTDAAAREWKAALEDPQAAVDFKTASIWAAIRELHGGVLRTPYGVLVASRQAVDDLLFDRRHELTSTGYLPRMRQSFGAIYLGMDAGQEDARYEEESRECNREIEALANTPAKRTAIFERAQKIVTDKIRYFAEQAKERAVDDEISRVSRGTALPRLRLSWELTLDIRELIDELLAVFCEAWFGLSTADDILQRSGFRWTWKPGDPPCYPGHFMAPSRYIFQPYPEATVEAVGMAHGGAMRDAMEAFLATHGTRLSAPVARAVLDLGPSKTNLPLAARTLVGALMGMVPTVDANLRRVLERWLGEGVLWSLRASWKDAPQDQAFRDAIADAFKRTMQARVAPDTLWRTAQKGFTLAPGTRHAVRVAPGEVLVAGLASAAHEGIDAGSKPDVAVAFGGDRGTTPHPTHACPGYGPAMEMMAGFVAGLVRSSYQLRPGPTATTFTLGEHIDNPALPKWKSTPPTILKGAVAPKTVWTYGDSWVADLPQCRSNLAKELTLRGHSVNWEHSSRGRKLAEMAQTRTLDGVCDALGALPKGAIHALVVGGGGNDITNNKKPRKSQLFAMLKQGATTEKNALDELVVAKFVDHDLYGYYDTILRRLLAATGTLDIPILVHAYARPIPDGDLPECTFSFPPLPPVTRKSIPWLGPVFKEREMGSLDVNTKVMGLLIDRLNDMVAKVVKDLGGGRLQHLDLRGLITETNASVSAYKAAWKDELHPTEAGFKTLADKMASMVPGLV